MYATVDPNCWDIGLASGYAEYLVGKINYFPFSLFVDVGEGDFTFRGLPSTELPMDMTEQISGYVSDK